MKFQKVVYWGYKNEQSWELDIEMLKYNRVGFDEVTVTNRKVWIDLPYPYISLETAQMNKWWSIVIIETVSANWKSIDLYVKLELFPERRWENLTHCGQTPVSAESPELIVSSVWMVWIWNKNYSYDNLCFTVLSSLFPSKCKMIMQSLCSLTRPIDVL